jgi:hypothetical protein
VDLLAARTEEFGLELLEVRLIAEHPADHPPPGSSSGR